jgi:8-oxo-dGTP pyrophosphatase MutT (NUDIX family)
MSILNRPVKAPAEKKKRHTKEVKQLAALCTRKGKSGREVLLVTSSNGRWILPKGWPMDGKSDRDAALQEAWEEAGVQKAKASKQPVAQYQGDKRYDDGSTAPCSTDVFAVKVKETRKSWPESDRRERIWVSPKKAIRLVDDPGLIEILKDL